MLDIIISCFLSFLTRTSSGLEELDQQNPVVCSMVSSTVGPGFAWYLISAEAHITFALTPSERGRVIKELDVARWPYFWKLAHGQQAHMCYNQKHVPAGSDIWSADYVCVYEQLH